jgi:arsenate reductase
MNDLPKLKSFEMQDIKTEAITKDQIEKMFKLAGTFVALFSRRAMKYKSEGLNKMTLDEKDYKKHILREYTYLKRPVVIIDDQIFIGSAKSNLTLLEQALEFV